MQKTYMLFLIVWIVLAQTAMAQTTPFSAVWSFEGNDNGVSSNPLVVTQSVSYVGVNKFGPNPYTSGFSGQSVNVQNWSTTLCNQTEYVQFSIQPVGAATISLTTLSFAFSRSQDGPRRISVRSSIDGFGSDIYSNSTATSYQTAPISLGASGFSNQSGQITFRIYACNPVSGGATLHLDELTIGGAVTATPLPVTLISFTAKSEGDRVQLAWATTMERDADRFVVHRSSDLTEFVHVGELPANGTTDERQYYGLTDFSPLPGTNYYRLTQIDSDGTPHEFKPVSAIIRVDEPVVAVFPNPADPTRIHLRLWKADNAPIRLLTPAGQTLNGRLERRPGEADLLFDQPLSPGLYWVEVLVSGQRKVVKVLVR